MNRRAVDPALASGKSPTSVVGRDAELSRIGAVAAAARSGSGSVLLIDGPPGIGKTTLLRAAAGRAGDVRCLWMHGVESEAVLGHAGLLELLTPLRDLVAELPSGQAGALAAALGWQPVAEPPDRFLVGAATLSLLGAAAARGPVLVLVDDLQWVDPESTEALLFAAARLDRDGVGLLVAAREGASLPAFLRNGPGLRLAGLRPQSAVSLLADQVSDRVAEQLVAATGGVPLALLDVLPELTAAQRVGAAPLPEPLPVGPRLGDGYAALLASLSAEAWRAVLLLAVGAAADAGRVLAALAEDGLAVAALDEAEARGVLVRDGAGTAFRHPLLRTAALRRSTGAERRAAHRALARALPGEHALPERVWHLALAADGPDDELAGELAGAAAAHRGRWGPATASAALERAAFLTTSPDRAAGWLAAATEEAALAGDVARARQLADRVLTGPGPPSARSRVLVSTGVLEEYAGSVVRAAELLERGAEHAAGARLVRVLTELVLTRFRLGDLGGIGGDAVRIAEVADRADPAQRLLADFTGGVVRLLTGDTSGRELLQAVVDQVGSPVLRAEPQYLMLMALASGFLGNPRQALLHGSARIDELRSEGAVGVLVPCLAIRAGGRAMIGDHPGAFADAGEAAELGELIGYVSDTAVALETVAWQSAARGRHAEARSALERARELTDRAGTTAVAAHQALTAAFCALSRGDPAEVVRVLEARLTADGGVGAMGEPLGVAPLLVEGYAAVGSRDEAAALSRRYADVVPRPAGPLDAALIARCAALTAADDEAAAEAFEEALVAHASDVDPFEFARTRLLFGSRLRRSGRRVEARGHLTTAAEAFESMELTAWYRRAADELGATGARARSRRPSATESLTSQETRVALLVATGSSNREVAAALFLSPKTVERHLGSVFRKRGFRSRAELAAAFAAAPPDPSP